MKSFRNNTLTGGLLPLAMVAIILQGCGGEAVPPESTTTAVASGARITAEPNPVPPSAEKLGKTTITWDTGSNSVGEVYVSINSQPERRFSGALKKGTQDASWIGKGEYEFRLYDGKEHKTVLASVKVTRAK